MKRYIDSLEDGEKLQIMVMIKSMNKGVTSKGAPYLSFVLEDKTGTIDAKYWSVPEGEMDAFQPGMIVDIHADTLMHNGQMQIRVHKIQECKEGYEMEDFIRTGNFTLEELHKEVKRYIEGMQNPTIKKVITALMQEYSKEFFEFPAAAKNHHDFYRGLSSHVLGMLRLAEEMCKLYPILNSDLLYAGVITHDLGKVIELSGPVATEYTPEGKLLGHISIMQAEVLRIATQLEVADTEEVMLIRHMILSHHGKYEYGSPVLPMFPEAEMLTFIDNIDARMQTFEKTLDKIEPGNFTGRIFSLENRSLYKTKL